MADVVAPEPEPAEEPLLEGEHHGEPVDRGREPAGPSRPPGPELGRNVVEHLGPRPPRRLGHADVKAGIVDEDDEVVAAGSEVGPERAEQPEVRSELGDHLHQAESGEAFHRVADGRPGGGHAGPAERPR